ncbi:MAG: HAMP domain-containing histidine kinase, partial [Pseudomonadales bacterium]|nr:HAMP domain-containing histidine kinase [Pseudomonadales bacterium]
SQLRSPVLDDVGRLRVAHKVEGRLQHIEELIESMLTFIRGGDGALGEFDVAGLMSELKTTLAPALADKGGTMMMMSDVPASLTLVGARNDLLSVLIAIAENAIGLIDVPAIAVRVEADDRFVDIFVADNGPGIPREIESRLFDPFFSTRANGTGLGLAIAAVTARNHGGDLTVQANEYGGATFRLRLARYGAEDVAASRPLH